jgi:hypothetical protein
MGGDARLADGALVPEIGRTITSDDVRALDDGPAS